MSGNWRACTYSPETCQNFPQNNQPMSAVGTSADDWCLAIWRERGWSVRDRGIGSIRTVTKLLQQSGAKRLRLNGFASHVLEPPSTNNRCRGDPWLILLLRPGRSHTAPSHHALRCHPSIHWLGTAILNVRATDTLLAVQFIVYDCYVGKYIYINSLINLVLLSLNNFYSVYVIYFRFQRVKLLEWIQWKSNMVRM